MTHTPTQVALVTGGNRGLGLETARQLVARGYRVLLGARDRDAGLSAAGAIGGSNVRAVGLDVASDVDVANCHTLIEQDYGRLDVLINNAAVHYDSDQTPLTADLRIVREGLDTNVIGAWRVAQMAAGSCVAGATGASSTCPARLVRFVKCVRAIRPTACRRLP